MTRYSLFKRFDFRWSLPAAIRTRLLPAVPFTLSLALILLQSCGGPSTLRQGGLAYLKIGDAMPQSGAVEFAGYHLSSAITTEGEYAWRTCTLSYPEGQVLVESDFLDQKRVGRIRVETPELKVRGGLRVGQTLADLRKRSRNWVAAPYPAYEVVEMHSKKYPGIVFLLRPEGFDYEEAASGVEADSLPGDALVVGIVAL